MKHNLFSKDYSAKWHLSPDDLCFLPIDGSIELELYPLAEAAADDHDDDGGDDDDDGPAGCPHV